MSPNLATHSELSFINLNSSDPIELYREWHSETKKFLKGFTDIVCLGTVSRDSRPRTRHVFLQKYDANGFLFFTDERGRKSQEIAANNHVSMCVHWIYTNDKDEKIIKQVRMEGSVEILPPKESEKFYDAQPFYAKIRSHLCHQDAVIDWNELKERHDNLVERAKIDNSVLKMPEYYIGYSLTPVWMDFYLSTSASIADRIEFERNEDGKNWVHRRLAA